MIKKFSILLFLLLFFATGVMSNDTPKKTVKARELLITAYNYNKSLIFDIDLVKIPELKEYLAKTYFFNIGFDVNAVCFSNKSNYNSYINRIKKNELGNVNMHLSDKKSNLLFLTESTPNKLYFAVDQIKFEIPLKVTIKKLDKNNDLIKTYYSSLLQYIKNQYYNISDDHELLYRIKVLEKRVQGSNINLDNSWRRNRGNDFINLIELTSGAQAMEGSLQFSVFRDISVNGTVLEKNISVSTLIPPQLKAHDFNAMLKGEKIKTKNIDLYAPHDAIYCRFSHIDHLFEVLDIAKLIQDQLPLFTSFIDWKDDSQTKLLTQLGLKINPELRKFYSFAIDEMSLVIEDPYLIEGSDLALVFKLSNKSLFNNHINKYHKEFKESIPGAVLDSIEYKGVKIITLTSPDHRLSSYSFEDGQFAIIASSEWMAKRIIDSSKGEVKSIATNLDYQYLMKVNDGGGDAFIYIGDDFVSRIISAPFKIAEFRRVNCEANLKILKYARNLYKIENQNSKSEPSIKDLIDSGYLSLEPICPHGGKYDLKEGSEPCCSKHGSLGYLLTLSSNEVDMVTENESNQYKEFVNNYHRYWRKFVDPIGIRIDLKDTVKVRTVILPLIEHPDYKMINDIMGGSTITLDGTKIGNSSVIFHFSSKLKLFDEYKSDLSHIKDDRLRDEIKWERERFYKKLNRNGDNQFKEDPLAWIGNEADFFIIDDNIPINESGNSYHVIKNEETLFNLFIGRIKVTDYDLAKKAIPVVMKYLFKTNFTSEKKYDGEMWKMYNIISSRIPVNILLRKDGLWIACQERPFEKMFKSKSFFSNLFKSEKDKVVALDKQIDIPSGRKTNYEIGIHPQNIQHLKGFLNLGIQKFYNEYCRENINRFNLLMLLHEPFAWTKPDAAAEILSKYTTGNSIICPMNGVYHCNHDNPYCSLHNYKQSDLESADYYEKVMKTETGLSNLLYKFKNIIIDLGFTEEGLETQVYISNPLK